MGLMDLFNTGYDAAQKARKAKKQYKKSKAITDPFYEGVVDTGSAANSSLADFLGLNGTGSQQSAYDNFLTSPGYDYRFSEGQKAINTGAAARGGLNSGANLKALQNYGQNMYANEYNQHLANLFNSTGLGFQGASGLMNNASGLANLLINEGNTASQAQQASLGNLLGVAGTAIGTLTGMPTGGNPLGANPFSSGSPANITPSYASPQMPTYFGMNGRINPYDVY